MPRLPPYGVHIFGSDPRRNIRDYGAPLSERAVELQRAYPEAVLVGCSAARVHGLDVLPPGIPDTTWPIEVTLPGRAGNSSIDGCVVRRIHVPTSEIMSFDRIRSTCPERTMVDCGRWLSRPQALAAADQLLRHGASRARAAVYCDESRGQMGIRRSRQILAMADPKSESPGESWVRCLMLDAGLPAPMCQHVLFNGEVRMDLAYPWLRLAVEYDGREFHQLSNAAHDRDRRARVVGHGWSVLSVRSDAVLVDPDSFFRQLIGRMLDAGWTPDLGRRRMVQRRVNFIGMQYRLAREMGLLREL